MSRLSRAFARKFSQAARDEKGVIAVLSAVLMLSLMGALSVSVDIAYFRYRQNTLQAAADAAAVDAALTKKGGGTTIQVKLDAMYAAQKNGWSASKGTATVNVPPLTGPQTASLTAVEVILTSSEVRFFSNIYQTGNKAFRARSVASLKTTPSSTGSGCVLALSTTASASVNFNGASSTNPACEVMSNSNSGSAISVSGTIAGTATAVGNITGGTVGTRHPFYPAVADPYAALSLPSTGAGACLDPVTAIPMLGVMTLVPGHYCKGFTVSNSAVITLNPGIYYIDSVFSLGNNSRVSGTGITLAFGPAVTSPDLLNNSTLSIDAPTSGTTSGIAITTYTDNAATTSFIVSNNATLNWGGVVYLPRGAFGVSNNGNLSAIGGSVGCGHIVSDTMTFSSNVLVGNSCSGKGLQPFGTSGAAWAAMGGTSVIATSE